MEDSSINIPLLALAGGLLAPTGSRSFGASLSNGLLSYAPALANERQTKKQDELTRWKRDRADEELMMQKKAAEDAKAAALLRQQNIDRALSDEQLMPQQAPSQPVDIHPGLAPVLGKNDGTQGLASVLAPQQPASPIMSAATAPQVGASPIAQAASPTSYLDAQTRKHQRLLQISEKDLATELRQMIEARKGVVVGEKSALADPFDGREMYRNNEVMTPKDQAAIDKDKIAALNNEVVFGPDGKPIVNQDYVNAKARIAREGSTKITNTLGGKADDAMSATIAAAAGKRIDKSVDVANGAAGTISTVHRLRNALDSGSVVTGTGAKARLSVDRLASTLGVAGKSAEERLVETRKMVQGLAQLQLDAAKQMEGQGQIIGTERELLAEAGSAKIDVTSEPEMRALLDVFEKVARYQIERHNNTTIAPIRANPRLGNAADTLAVEMPAPYRGKSAVNEVAKPAPQGKDATSEAARPPPNASRQEVIDFWIRKAQQGK